MFTFKMDAEVPQELKDNKNKSYIYNCFVSPKEGETELLLQIFEDTAIVRLNGYAIIPMEEYNKLKNK
jgi:hypothetical protein